MDYELVTVIRPNNLNWDTQKDRLKKGGRVLSISPSPDFYDLLKKEQVEGFNLLDMLTGRSYSNDKFLFFNQIPTVFCAEIFMNENRSISIISDGDEIGRVVLYPNTRRHVKEVQYLNIDGTKNYIEEYASDGKLFSTMFFFNNQVQEIDFYNNQQIPVVTYFFYNDNLNLITLRDAEDGKVIKKFNNLLDFIRQTLADFLTAQDSVSITYLGMELLALKDTKSVNTFYLEESPFNEKGEVKGNLLSILNNEIDYIQTVVMGKEHFEQLKIKKICLDKVIIKEEIES